MVAPLPWTTSSPQGSQWSAAFTFENDDESLMDLTGKTFELVLRDAPSSRGAPAAMITSTATTASGGFVIDIPSARVLAVLSPTATGALSANDTYSLALWVDPDLNDASAVVVGGFYVQPVAAP